MLPIRVLHCELKPSIIKSISVLVHFFLNYSEPGDVQHFMPGLMLLAVQTLRNSNYRCVRSEHIKLTLKNDYDRSSTCALSRHDERTAIQNRFE